MDDPDLQLINATGRGDREAFTSLVRKFQGPLLNFITRYVGGDRSLAEDIAQEVFLRIFRAAHRFEARSKVSTWIFHIAYNQTMTEMERRKRHRGIREAVIHRREDAGSIEPSVEPFERFELEEEIQAALGLLPENQRAALLLRVKEDLSYQEIAEVIGVSVQSVESLLFRARTTLRQHLKKM